MLKDLYGSAARRNFNSVVFLYQQELQQQLEALA